jgi:hypothetical protein
MVVYLTNKGMRVMPIKRRAPKRPLKLVGRIPMALRPSGFTRARKPSMLRYAAQFGTQRAKKQKKFNTTLNQKLKTESRENARLIKMGGCSILRMCMQNTMPLVSATDAGFNNAGYGTALLWTGQCVHPTVQFGTTTYPTQAFEAYGHEFRHAVVAFLPQCPSSKACFNLSAIGASVNKDQRFGVIPNYSGYNAHAENYSFNQFPMKDTYGFNTDTPLAVTTTWESGNTLKVFRSWARIELENPNYQCGMRVHILVVKLRSIKYNDGSTCENQINLNTWPSNLAGSHDTTAEKANAYFAYLNECRGKLPSKIFRVIKRKVVTLGPKLVNSAPNSGTFYRYAYANNNAVPSPRSTKTVTMAFGPKTIRRTHCSDMSDGLFTFQEMNENWNSQSIVMMYTEPLDAMAVMNSLNNPTDSTTPDFLTLGVNYRIHKTHKWKVVNNFSN